MFSDGIVSPPRYTYDLDDELGHFAHEVAVDGLISRIEMGCHWFDGYTDDEYALCAFRLANKMGKTVVNIDTGLWERGTHAIDLVGQERIVSANFEVKES